MSEYEWVSKEVVLAVHDELLGEHGGPMGIRDAGMLDSALARPLNMAAYDDSADVAALAAAYAYGLAKNHAFADGNKRIAFTTAVVFLRLNGHTLTAAGDDCVLTMLGVAGGTLSEAELAAWFRENIAPL